MATATTEFAPGPSKTLGFTLPRAAASVLAAVADLVGHWRRPASDRRHLATLDDFMLRDIGVSRADVEVELSKPFWRQ